MEVKYPDIKVMLSESDGNSFAVLGVVRKALKRAGVSPEEVKEFQKEALSGTYDHLLRACMRWVDVG